jgi:hypothetical protein
LQIPRHTIRFTKEDESRTMPDAGSPADERLRAKPYVEAGFAAKAEKVEAAMAAIRKQLGGRSKAILAAAIVDRARPRLAIPT